MEQLFEVSAFYVLLGISGFWCFALVQLLQNLQKKYAGVRRQLLQYRWLLLWTLVLTGLLFALSPPRIKIGDEINHIGIAQSFYSSRSPRMVMSQSFDGDGLGDSLRVTETYVPARPVFFSFLISVVDIFAVNHGSWRNVFVTNFFVTWFLLFLGSVAGGRVRGTFGSWIAPLLLLSVPAVAIWATSGTYDILAAAFSVLVVLLLRDFQREPRNRHVFGFFLASLAVYSHIRWEGIVAAVVVLAGLGVLGYLRRPLLRSTWPALMCFAAALALRILQIWTTWAEHTDLTNIGVPNRTQFVSNAFLLLRELFLPVGGAPYYPQILNCLGVLAVLHALFRRRAKVPLATTLLPATFPVLMAMVALPFTWGTPNMQLAVRHYIPGSFWLSLGILCLPLPNKRVLPVALFTAFTICMLGDAARKIARAPEHGATFGAKYFNIVPEILGDTHGRKIMILAPENMSQFYTILGFASEYGSRARAVAENLVKLLSSPKAPEVYVLQHMDMDSGGQPQTKTEEPVFELKKPLKLVPLGERVMPRPHLTPRLIRLSQVKLQKKG